MKKINIKIRFTDPVLGMAPSNENIYEDFILTKQPDLDFDRADELEAIRDLDSSNGMTVFPRDEDGNPCFWDYQIRGFFKDSCGLLGYVKGTDETGKRSKKKTSTLSGNLTAYKKVIDGNIFVTPRMIRIHTDKPIGTCQRPLRAMTAKGERNSLACSEQIEAGAWMEFTVICLNDLDVDLVAEWMRYGALHGMGQWRNSGKGRFDTEVFEVKNATSADLPGFKITYAD